LKGRSFAAYEKNSGFDFVLKGRGFSRAVSATQLTQALAAEGVRSVRCHLFRACSAALKTCFSFAIQPNSTPQGFAQKFGVIADDAVHSRLGETPHACRVVDRPNDDLLTCLTKFAEEFG
jgi:hypothetical protein